MSSMVLIIDRCRRSPVKDEGDLVEDSSISWRNIRYSSNGEIDGPNLETPAAG